MRGCKGNLLVGQITANAQTYIFLSVSYTSILQLECKWFERGIGLSGSAQVTKSYRSLQCTAFGIHAADNQVKKSVPLYRHWGSVQAVRPIWGIRSIALLFLDHGTRRGDGSALRPVALYPRGKRRYPLYRRLGGPQGRSGQVRKISPPPKFDPWTVHPVASCCTDWPIRSTIRWQHPRFYLQQESQNVKLSCIRHEPAQGGSRGAFPLSLNLGNCCH